MNQIKKQTNTNSNSKETKAAIVLPIANQHSCKETANTKKKRPFVGHNTS